MSVHGFRHLLILSFVVAAATFFTPGYSTGAENSRRILHQPLFPVGSEPPAGTDSAPPPPPPPPADPVLPSPEQPFFPEVPGGQSPDQNPQPPPPPAQQNESPVSNPIASQPVKKVAIALSVGIVTLGMLSALGFYLYKHRVKRPDESQKLVGDGGGGGGSQRINEESRMPPSTFLYIGTVEPSTRTSVSETNEANGSPYRKLSSVKRSDRYRPSPDLQPLPPLSKPQPPPDITSPPAMSSSDEESRDTAFYTPQGSTISNDDGYYTPVSRRSQAKAEARANNHYNNNNSSTPHSKRTSPKSRLSASPSDVKPAIIPSIKQSPAPSQYDRPTMPYIPKRAKFSSPPPPPDMTRLQLISGQTQQPSKLPVPPPPPPPPPPSAPRKLAISQKNSSPLAPSEPAKQESCPSPKTPQDSAKTSPSGETERGPSTLERCDSDDIDGSKPKLKALHWDKVRATSDRATVWDQLKSSSFQLNEDMMESLFGCNSANSVPKETIKKPKSVVPPGEQENRVLDPKKSQNIAILLRALNVTKEEVSEALIDGNPEGLGSELLETLVRMAPTKEEEIKLRDCTSDTSKLGSAERFLKTVLDVPFAFKRVEAMLYRANFESEVNYLRKSFQTLEEASEELKNSRLFLKLLEAVLRTGNRMNTGTNRGDARAFKLDTLLKLVDIKGTDGKTTLLHFVVQEIIRSEGVDSNPAPNENLPNMKPKEEDLKRQELQVVAGLSRELGNVKKAAGMDSDVLHTYVSKLETGLGKVRMVLELEKPGVSGKFFESMKMFLKEAEDEIIRIKAEERKALSVVKEVTEYFHGDAAKEGAHPFRVFMIVRDFLSILDNVCKDVGKMHDRTVVGSARSFRIPANASLPVLSRYNVRHHNRSSDDDSMSP